MRFGSYAHQSRRSLNHRELVILFFCARLRLFDRWKNRRGEIVNSFSRTFWRSLRSALEVERSEMLYRVEASNSVPKGRMAGDVKIDISSFRTEAWLICVELRWNSRSLDQWTGWSRCVVESNLGDICSLRCQLICSRIPETPDDITSAAPRIVLRDPTRPIEKKKLVPFIQLHD